MRVRHRRDATLYAACLLDATLTVHVPQVAQWLRELRQKPGWNRDKTPNDALRLINRIENLQYLIWRANLDKGSDYTEAIRNDLAEYEKCFYSATQLRESDVLSRKYLPLSKVLKNVKAWAESKRRQEEIYEAQRRKENPLFVPVQFKGF